MSDNDERPSLFGFDLFGKPIERTGLGVLARRYIVPPFSVLDAKSGDWQARKQEWQAIGIKGELGRDGGLAYTNNPAAWMKIKGDGANRTTNETSVFDPVLCEILYGWHCPISGQVIDPFAGGSSRGIVAGWYGYEYWGCDLSARQIAANESQADTILVAPRPRWIVGDALDRIAEAPEADFLLTCPPYGNLERYSDDPRDLSAMGWIAYTETLQRIVKLALARLRPNRFACFVVGNFRDRAGFYRHLVGETYKAFALAGAHLYNDAVLLPALGTASARAEAQFDKSRKVVKVHQNVLTFCKGDPRLATLAVKGLL